MKASLPANRMLASFGLATGALLTSCVAPYYAAPQATGDYTTVTTYRPGYEVAALPAGYRAETIGGARYYRHGETYYRPRSGRYVVVEAPRQRPIEREVIIRRLPPGYRVTTHQGIRYYRVDNVYYQQRGSDYVAVRRPY
ncbi:MAG: DUF6515 family protein [Akkermansiaceae bacterium]